MTRGLYVQQLNGQIHSVQVEDTTGMNWPVEPMHYMAKGDEPSIDELPNLETYTRNRFLAAISAAFGDAFTISPSGTWHVIVESTPKREIVLMPSFVIRNIDGGHMQPGDLTQHLQSIPDSNWAMHTNGMLTLALN